MERGNAINYKLSWRYLSRSLEWLGFILRVFLPFLEKNRTPVLRVLYKSQNSTREINSKSNKLLSLSKGKHCLQTQTIKSNWRNRSHFSIQTKSDRKHQGCRELGTSYQNSVQFWAVVEIDVSQFILIGREFCKENFHSMGCHLVHVDWGMIFNDLEVCEHCTIFSHTALYLSQ